MMLLWRVDHSLWLYSRLPVTVCDVALACRLWSVTLSQDVGHSLRCCVSDGLWRDPGVCRSRSVMGSRSPSVKVCDGVTESVGHGLWRGHGVCRSRSVGGGKFLPLNTSTLSFRSCFTKQDWKSKKKKQRNVNDKFDNIKRKKFFVASSITRLCKTSGRLAIF